VGRLGLFVGFSLGTFVGCTSGFLSYFWSFSFGGVEPGIGTCWLAGCVS
jgi:hypothetical protein